MSKFDVPFCRSAFNYDRDVVSRQTGLECKDVSLTKQSFLEETDINVIVKRHGLGYELPQGVRVPSYADYEGVFDFHAAMNVVAQANESFDALPAAVRARFNHDPAEFVEFCMDDENRAEAVKWGLVEKPLEAVQEVRREAPAVNLTPAEQATPAAQPAAAAVSAGK